MRQLWPGIAGQGKLGVGPLGTGYWIQLVFRPYLASSGWPGVRSREGGGQRPSPDPSCRRAAEVAGWSSVIRNGLALSVCKVSLTAQTGKYISASS